MVLLQETITKLSLPSVTGVSFFFLGRKLCSFLVTLVNSRKTNGFKTEPSIISDALRNTLDDVLKSWKDILS